MTVKHHNIFKVYLPKTIEGGEESLTPKMIIEEAYLLSNGTVTPDFLPNDQDRNPLDVVLYPSFIFASKKFYQTETEQLVFINDIIDSEFCSMLLIIRPVYRITEFIDFHYDCYNGDKSIFLKHIKFVILPLIKKKIVDNSESKELKKEGYPEFSIVSEIVLSWIKIKEDQIKPRIKPISIPKFETNIKKAGNVIFNNECNINTQSIELKHKSKTKKSKILTIIGLIISFIMLVIAIITEWDKLFK